MDSINKQQEEKNHEDLLGKDAIEKMRKLIDAAGSCFFQTESSISDSHSARPMSVQKTDDSGNIWFLSSVDSKKNAELLANPKAKLFFQGSSHSDFLELHGEVSISQEKTKIKELYDPIVKVWFTEGVDDPRITVLQFKPQTGYYWDTKHGNAIAGIKMLIGAISGKTLDDSIEGKINI
jgi:general stress protein 26